MRVGPGAGGGGRSGGAGGAAELCGLCCRQAERRAATAGLGMAGSTSGAVAGDTYKDCVKKTMFARYKELNEE